MNEAKNIQEPTKKVWSIACVIGCLFLWFKVVIQGKKEMEGYKYKEIGNLPLTGVHHFKGYEIINQKTNKVLYRKVKDWGTLGYSSSDYNPMGYDTVSKFFPQNAL